MRAFLLRARPSRIREIGVVAFCVSELRRFSKFSVERLVGRIRRIAFSSSRRGKSHLSAAAALHQGWRPAPDPIPRRKFRSNSPEPSPRYEFHRSLSPLSPSNAYPPPGRVFRYSSSLLVEQITQALGGIVFKARSSRIRRIKRLYPLAFIKRFIFAFGTA